MNRDRMIDRKMRHAAAALLLAVLGGGCGDRTGPDPQPDRSSVTLTPTRTTIVVFHTIFLAAIVRDPAGTAINSPSVTWTSSDPAVATAQASPIGSIPWVTLATVVGVSPGSVTITATSGAASAKATVTVSPSLSPPGLAFVSQRDGNEEIYRMNPDGSGQIRLTDNPGRDLNPVWSPEGERIAFRSDRQGDGPGYDIYVMNADGGTQTGLDVAVQCCIFPFMSWSPDGQMIAITMPDDIYGGDTGHVALVNVARRTVSKPAPTQTSNFDPIWSPDGRRILFRSAESEDADLYLVNAPPGSAGTPFRLTNNAAADYVPYWSPDGQKITFVSERDGNDEIYLINADGSGQINLTNNAALDRNPQWSPDGQKIAFVSDRDGSKGIYVMNADGSAQTYLTNAAGNERRPAVVAGRPEDRVCVQPRWKCGDLRDEQGRERADQPHEQRGS